MYGLTERELEGQVGTLRDPVRLRRYLQVLAASSGGTPAVKTLVDAARIDRSTATAYDTLLESLFITERLPAWSANRLSRLVRLPKRHIVDPAFLGPLLGVDLRGAMRDGDLLGRILDSFVVAQLRADCGVSELRPRLFHLRDAIGTRFAAGVVLQTGPRAVRIGETISALPICALWG